MITTTNANSTNPHAVFTTIQFCQINATFLQIWPIVAVSVPRTSAKLLLCLWYWRWHEKLKHLTFTNKNHCVRPYKAIPWCSAQKQGKLCKCGGGKQTSHWVTNTFLPQNTPGDGWNMLTTEKRHHYDKGCWILIYHVLTESRWLRLIIQKQLCLQFSFVPAISLQKMPKNTATQFYLRKKKKKAAVNLPFLAVKISPEILCKPQRTVECTFELRFLFYFFYT